MTFTANHKSRWFMWRTVMGNNAVAGAVSRNVKASFGTPGILPESGSLTSADTIQFGCALRLSFEPKRLVRPAGRFRLSS